MMPAANAATVTESYPETPAINAKLPIIHTTHGSDHKKANVLNPRPVCNPWEDHRTSTTSMTLGGGVSGKNSKGSAGISREIATKLGASAF
ncbi:hypothetical protein ACL1FC_10830 [Corynebacterium striatum]|uniref:hypothetical protein n=1 Tax=Corynebacterium striatum TaxID=43770 RepID=UPI001F0D494A|nr:hypothetical protein [Corynebacterium striatum]